jgi:peptidyl-prolyl cis-trans isomerase A (cyclophilin A)
MHSADTVKKRLTISHKFYICLQMNRIIHLFQNQSRLLANGRNTSIFLALDSVTFLLIGLMRRLTADVPLSAMHPGMPLTNHWLSLRFSMLSSLTCTALALRSNLWSMIKRFTAASLILYASSALAQTGVAPPPAPVVAAASPAAKFATVRVAFLTSEGLIMLELEKQRAPITTANFLKYVDQKRWDGVTFYRATNVAKDPLLGLIQGGARNDPKRVLPPIAHEPTTKTGLSNTDGAISMARGKPGSANADFFIIVGDMTSLNADPKATGDNLGFAAFGRVVEGMDIVRKILAAPISPTLGAGLMRGQMLARPVKIISARRAK